MDYESYDDNDDNDDNDEGDEKNSEDYLIIVINHLYKVSIVNREVS